MLANPLAAGGTSIFRGSALPAILNFDRYTLKFLCNDKLKMIYYRQIFSEVWRGRYTIFLPRDAASAERSRRRLANDIKD
jgi:hypothetical protein